MRIIGFDPGTATTGWACVDAERGQKARLIGCGAITTPAKTSLATRLSMIHAAVVALLLEHRPDEVAVEELFFAKNRTTAIAVSHARGVILLAAAQAHQPVAEYTPMEVKLAIAGYGNANKKQIQAILPAHIDAANYPSQDDTADAIAIALTHLTVASNPLATALVGNR